MDRERFAHKTAVVTGAGSESGIGFAAARNPGLSGCRVAVTSTTERIQRRVAELKALGIEACGFVADLLAFLASDESRYITGQLVVSDGCNTLQEYKGPIESYY